MTFIGNRAGARDKWWYDSAMRESLHIPDWWTWWYAWSFFKFMLPIVVSLIALGYVLHDRRSRLVLKDRKGIWSLMRETHSVRGHEMMFEGVIEVYNLSSRANAIRAYRVFAKGHENIWIEMESEHSNNDPGDGGRPQIYNQSPLTLAPYSGSEVRVLGIVKMLKIKEYKIRVVIEDLFGHQSSIELVSYS